MEKSKLYKWMILSVLTAGAFSSCGGDSDKEDLDDFATDTSIAVTGNVSAITPVSAEIMCKANITQGGTSIELGVMYSSDSEILSAFNGRTVKTKDLVGNAYKVTLSSLKPNTTYYYRSYVASGGINNYGKVKSFTTKPVASPKTLQADTIKAFSAYLHAKREITRDFATEYGFSCDDGFVISEKKDSIEHKGRFISRDSYYYDSYVVNNYQSFQNGDYRIIVDGLQPQTTYYYMAYSGINGGYTFGAVKSFATGDFDKPSISTPTDITTMTASVIVLTNKLDNYTVSSIGVDYATDAIKLEKDYKTSTSSIITGTQHPVSLNGLTPNTTYYLRPFVSIITGRQTQIVYGEVKTFVTSEAPPRQTMTITTAGTYGWNIYKSSSYSNCLKSNNNGISSSTARSILSFTLNQKSTLSFGYMVSSELYNDKLTIKVDNITLCSGISGIANYPTNSVSLAKGDHTIILEYSKDPDGNRNDDCGYIYNIAINGELLSNDDFK